MCPEKLRGSTGPTRHDKMSCKMWKITQSRERVRSQDTELTIDNDLDESN